MVLTTNLDKLYFLDFPNTLKGSANQWFHSLKPRSISGFDQLSMQFISQFISMHEQPMPDTQLLTVRQKKGESLKEFVNHFNKEKLKVYDLDETVAITTFCSRVQDTKCAALFHGN